jgi:uncharacterized protein (DUF58 family)
MKWFLGILLILLAALILESGLLAYSMYVLLGLLFISRVMARNWIGNLRATRTCRLVGGDGEEPLPGGLVAEVGDKVSVRLTVRNEGAVPVPWVLMEDLLSRQALDKRFPRLKVKGKRLQIAMLRGGGEMEMKYTVECLTRGYFQVGPLTLESGDLFGLHRRFRVETEPNFVLVYPKVVGLTGYDLTSRRPIGDVRMTHRLYEDPTRIAGVRPYEAGDPLNRVHWRATARTGELHSKIYEPSTLAGATVFLDFHESGYPRQGEPFRSDLAVTAVASLANAVCEMGQQVGLVTNGRDAADRIRLEGWEHDPRTRRAAQQAGAMAEKSERLQPQVVPTRRGVEQLQRIREALARVELTDGLSFAELVNETVSRIPRDATVVAVLPQVPLESAIALGNLRRAGFAVTVVLVQMERAALELGYGRLIAENIRDIRHLPNEAMLPDLCRQHVDRSAPYALAGID